MSEQFHFDPDTYLDLITSELPAYRELQDATALASRGAAVHALLELGVGTGETTERVLRVHPSARVVGIDESEAMLAHARSRLPEADLRVGLLQDPLPVGPFDLVVSALAVHHLDGSAKRDLFRRVAEVLDPGGRFVLADVIVPDDPADAVTPIEAPYDTPSRLDEQLAWLAAAGMPAQLQWSHRDLVVVLAKLSD